MRMRRYKNFSVGVKYYSGQNLLKIHDGMNEFSFINIEDVPDLTYALINYLNQNYLIDKEDNFYEVSLGIEYTTQKEENTFSSCEMIVKENGKALNEISLLKNINSEIKKQLSKIEYLENEPILIRKDITLNGEYFDSDEWFIQFNKENMEIKILD